jgi:alkanesulfonate monooxygenase SsuD/methylene tetrahydromethanopterin reductase-like flavin-dependent oxidoreductase (luciferase family)
VNVLIGVNIATAASPEADPIADAVRAEQLGFDFVSSSDHPSGSSPTFETWTMLSFIAAATSRIGVATRVLGVPYRPPAMVAKMAETLDRLSGGRLILGLGSGHSDDEFRAFGLGVPTARQKVDGLRDAITIMRSLWTTPDFSYEGPVYRVERAPMEPKARRRIPIWCGTYGPRALAVTGELADGWIPSLGSAAPEEIPGMRACIDAAAQAASRDPGEITGAYNIPVRVEPGGTGSAETVVGTADEVTERLIQLIGLGFQAINIMPLGPGAREQMERIAAEVAPALRVA